MSVKNQASFSNAIAELCSEDKSGSKLMPNKPARAVPAEVRIVPGKRAMDILLASILLLLAAPLLAILAIIIKMDSPGSIIFSQRRLGLHGQEFNCYKLRTMFENNQDILDQYFQERPERQNEWDTYAKLKAHDPRVTTLGRWLRRSSLDELPQLINVLKGEMSLVGPRPYLPAEKVFMGAYADTILAVVPGMTGLWQVNGRNNIDFAGRLGWEQRYISDRSLGLDIIILFKTLPAVFRQEGAC